MYCKSPWWTAARAGACGEQQQRDGGDGAAEQEEQPGVRVVRGPLAAGAAGARATAATTASGARSMVSSDMPSSAPSVAVLRIRP